MDYRISEITPVVVRLLVAAGLSNINAHQVADVFIRAHRRNMEHHDLSYLPVRLKWLMSGQVDAKTEPILFEKRGAISYFDGHNSLGELCCHRLTMQAINDAQEHGIALATIKNSNHFLAGAPYAELGSESGTLVMIYSSTDATMAGPPGRGDTTPIIGNNPFSAGFPTRDGTFVLDMCMAYASLGTLHKKALEGETVPDFFGYDSRGKPSGDPNSILQGGSLAPMAGHKGFGLALLVELLTGGLSGGHMGLEIPPGGGVSGHSQTVIAINLQPYNPSPAQSNKNPLVPLPGLRFSKMIDEFSEKTPNIRYPGSKIPPNTTLIKIQKKVIEELLTWWDRLGIAEKWPL